MRWSAPSSTSCRTSRSVPSAEGKQAPKNACCLVPPLNPIFHPPHPFPESGPPRSLPREGALHRRRALRLPGVLAAAAVWHQEQCEQRPVLLGARDYGVQPVRRSGEKKKAGLASMPLLRAAFSSGPGAWQTFSPTPARPPGGQAHRCGHVPGAPGEARPTLPLGAAARGDAADDLSEFFALEPP